MAKTRAPKNRGQLQLAPGVMRFSRARLNYKKGVHQKKPFKAAKKAPAAGDNFVMKKVGGSKNGGERMVLKQRPVSFGFWGIAYVFKLIETTASSNPIPQNAD